MSAYGVLIIGASGTGKSYSMKKLDPASTVIVNIQGKKLPFKGGNKFNNKFTCDDFQGIMSYLEAAAKDQSIKTVIIDDFQYLVLHMHARKYQEKGYEKYAEIGVAAQQILDSVKYLRDDQVVYFLNHEELNVDGSIGVKVPCGRYVVEKVVPEGMFTMVLRSVIIDERYLLQTQNAGSDVCKSPEDMFTEKFIPNDMKFINECIYAYENDLDAPVAPSLSVATPAQPEPKPAKTEVTGPNAGLFGGAKTQPEPTFEQVQEAKALQENPVQTPNEPIEEVTPEPVEENPVQEKQVQKQTPAVNTTAETREDKVSSICAFFGSEQAADKFLRSRSLLKTPADTIDTITDQMVSMIYSNLDKVSAEDIAEAQK